MFCSGCSDGGERTCPPALRPWRVDAKVEAVQVQRMLDRRGVDQPPVHRVALRERQPLVVRPRLAVEHQRALERPVGIRVEPLGDQPDALLSLRGEAPGRIDDERAGELRVEPVAIARIW